MDKTSTDRIIWTIVVSYRKEVRRERGLRGRVRTWWVITASTLYGRLLLDFESWRSLTHKWDQAKRPYMQLAFKFSQIQATSVATLANSVFIDYTLCERALSCWNLFGPFSSSELYYKWIILRLSRRLDASKC